MERAQIVIVGGGIIGAAIAYNLAKQGVKDIVLLEKEMFFGAESTAKCAGGIRAQFGTSLNIQLSLESISLFERFCADMGVPVDYRQVGYLFLSTSPAEWVRAQANAAFQQSHGVPVELLDPDRIQELCPALELQDVLGGNFCSIDGLADPHGFLQGYFKVVRDRGVKVHIERPVTGFEVLGNRIMSVKTPKGDIPCEQVILAAGAWTGELGKLLGVEIPIVPVRRQIVTCSPMPWIDPNWPMMVDNGTGLYMHPESRGLLMGMANKQEPPGFNTTVDEAFTMEIAEAAFRRMPRLEEASIASSWAGLYEVTPDHNPILGRLPQFQNVIVAAGFSGHGFMHAPACGALIAELAMGQEPHLDIASLGIERFATLDSRTSEELMVI